MGPAISVRLLEVSVKRESTVSRRFSCHAFIYNQLSLRRTPLGPAISVRLLEVSVKRESTVSRRFSCHAFIGFLMGLSIPLWLSTGNSFVTLMVSKTKRTYVVLI